MVEDVVIRAEGLGKNYIIGHESNASATLRCATCLRAQRKMHGAKPRI